MYLSTMVESKLVVLSQPFEDIPSNGNESQSIPSNIHLSIVVKLNSFNQLVSISPQAAVAAEETTTEGQEGIAAPPLPFSYQHKQNLILCETDAVLTE